MNPPLRLNLLDSDGNKIESAGFLDQTYSASISVVAGDVALTAESVTDINFDDNGQAVFDQLTFTGFGSVSLIVTYVLHGLG